MTAPYLASLLLVLQTRAPMDSATVTRVLNQLRTSDSTVCALAGEALTNYGGFWGGRSFGQPGLAMPQPMPTPMPMPGGGGGGGVHFGMHGRSRDVDPGVLRAFRAVIRDDNRCIRNIAARILGNHHESGRTTCSSDCCAMRARTSAKPARSGSASSRIRARSVR